MGIAQSLKRYLDGRGATDTAQACAIPGDWIKQPLGLATQAQVAAMYHDCEYGSGAYGLLAVMDDRLEGFSDIYLEGGDHRTLVHLNGRDFHRLMAQVPLARIGRHSHSRRGGRDGRHCSGA